MASPLKNGIVWKKWPNDKKKISDEDASAKNVRTLFPNLPFHFLSITYLIGPENR